MEYKNKILRYLEKNLVDGQLVLDHLSNEEYLLEEDLKKWVSGILEKKGLKGLLSGVYFEKYLKLEEVRASHELLHTRLYLINSLIKEEVVLDRVNLERMREDFKYVQGEYKEKLVLYNQIEATEFIKRLVEECDDLDVVSSLVDEYLYVECLKRKIKMGDKQLKVVEECLSLLV